MPTLKGKYFIDKPGRLPEESLGKEKDGSETEQQSSGPVRTPQGGGKGMFWACMLVW